MPTQTRAPQCSATAMSTRRQCEASAAHGTGYCQQHQDPSTRMPSTAGRQSGALPAAGSATLAGGRPAVAPPQGATLAAMGANAVRGGKPAKKRQRRPLDPKTMTTTEEVKQLMMFALRSEQVPLLKGDVGTGKTTLARTMAADEDMELLNVDMSTISEQAMITGLPSLQWDEEKGRNILTRTFEEQFEKLRQAREDEDAGRVPKKYLVFFDEVTTASPELTSAMLNLLSERKMGQWELPSNCWLVAAGNSAEHSQSATDLSEAARSRFIHIDMPRAPWDESAAWAKEQLAPGGKFAHYNEEKRAQIQYWVDVIGGFQRYNPNIYDSDGNRMARDDTGDAFASPRGMVAMARTLADADTCGDTVDPSAFYGQIAKGFCGEKVGKAFAIYARELDLPNPEEWLANPAAAGEFAKSSAARLDRLGIVLSRLEGIVDGLKPPAGLNQQEVRQWRQDNAVAAGMALCHVVEAEPSAMSQALARFNHLIGSDALAHAPETDEKLQEMVGRGLKVFKEKLDKHAAVVAAVVAAKSKSK